MARVLGRRTVWSTVGDGEFFCPECGGDRNYQRRTGRSAFAVLGVPVTPRSDVGPVVECAACDERFGLSALDHPTTRRFSAMLRDAVHTVALAVLAAGGAQDRAALRIAVGAVRSAGFSDCTQEQLSALIDALAADTGRLPEQACGAGATGLAIELHESLDPLAPHLAPAGRESILVQAARIALADGPYTPEEREVLGTVGSALTLSPGEIARVLAGAQTAAF